MIQSAHAQMLTKPHPRILAIPDIPGSEDGDWSALAHAQRERKCEPHRL